MASKTYSTDPALYIFTSLTAGSSHIVTATSRLETILRANRVPFKAVDIATDEKARMLWGRRAGKDESGRVRKLPGLIQEGLVLGDLVEIEDWNEYGELKQHVKIYYDEFTIPNIHNKPKDPPKPIRRPAAAAAASAAVASAAASSAKGTPAPAAPPLPKADASTTATEKKAAADQPKKSEPGVIEKVTLPIRSIADEAAQKAKELRLQSLREKVHGSKAGKETEAKKETDETKTETADKTPAPAAPQKRESTTSLASTASNVPPGTVTISGSGGTGTSVQSPTRGTWAPATASSDALPATEFVQSPTTARWKSTESFEPPVTTHRGSAVAAASQEEIRAVEQAEAIPEEEEESSEEEETSSEEEEDDDDDDEDESSDEEDDKKPVSKPDVKAAPAATAAPAAASK